MSTRAFPRLVAVVAFVALMLPTEAGAHAAYKDSNPPDESTVSSAPSEIWAEFTEPPAQGSTLSVFNECGDQVDLGDSRSDAFRLYISVGSVHSGDFRVEFRVTSTYDSHVTTGSFTFTATGGEDCAGPPPESGGDGGGGGNGGGGNGGGGDGGDGSSSQGGDGDDGSGEVEEVATISERGDNEGSRSQGRGGDGNGRERSGGDDSEGTDGDIGPSAADPSPDPPGIWDGIALSDLLVGFALAALIGAAGGKVYAGIVGPRR
jgi:methionine-rich copper-binding protein CopC